MLIYCCTHCTYVLKTLLYTYKYIILVVHLPQHHSPLLLTFCHFWETCNKYVLCILLVLNFRIIHTFLMLFYTS